VPVPAWLAEFAEAIGGVRLDQKGTAEPAPVETLLKLKDRLAAGSSSDFYTRWGTWIFADRLTRTISPYSSMTLVEYVDCRIQENTLSSLQEAVRLSPSNASALARLARQILAQDSVQHPERAAQADWYSRRAVELSPNDPEVLAVRTYLSKQTGELGRR
jgi:hypothetical protein